MVFAQVSRYRPVIKWSRCCKTASLGIKQQSNSRRVETQFAVGANPPLQGVCQLLAGYKPTVRFLE